MAPPDNFFKGPDYSKLFKSPDYSELFKQPNVSEVFKQPKVSEVFKQPNVSELFKVPDHTALFKQPDLSELFRRPDMTELLKAPRLAEVLQQSDYESLFSAPNIPTGAWKRLLGEVQAGAGLESSESFDEATSQFDAADDQLRSTDERETLWWLYRLPFVQQAALYLAVLKALDEVGKFLVDLAGEGDIPSEVRSGTQVLFALAAILMLILDAQSRAHDE